MKDNKISRRLMIAMLAGTIVLSVAMAGCGNSSENTSRSSVTSSSAESQNNDNDNSDNDSNDTEESSTDDTESEDDSDTVDEFSGICGESVTWVLKENGELVISGTGGISDFKSFLDIPWYKHGENIKTVVIEDGVTSICEYAFNGLSNVTSITIPNSVNVIGDAAFFMCDRLRTCLVSI